MSNADVPESNEQTKWRWRMQFSLRTLLLLVTLAAAVAGYFRWRWLQAENSTLDAQRFAFNQQFAAVPLVMGDWVGKDREMTHTLQEVQARGVANRVYRNNITGAKINLYVFRGPPLPACYSMPRHRGDGYDRQGDLRFRDYGLGKHVQSIQNADILNHEGKLLHELQAFSQAGEWSRPANPGLVFQGCAELTGLLMIYTSGDPKNKDGWQEFDSFVFAIFPHLQNTLFPRSPGITDPHSSDRPIGSHAPWVVGMALIASIGTWFYLTRRRAKHARQDHVMT